MEPDFIAHSGAMSSVWTIVAESEVAKEFARENFAVESWQGSPEHFATDWRVASDLCERLANEGFIVRGTL